MVAPGEILGGKYRIVRLIGDGGMGSVWEAEHERLHTRVAVKTLHRELTGKYGMKERFLREAHVAAEIRSPHIVPVIDVDEAPDGTAFMVMELLHGESLGKLIERERQISVQLACNYTMQILEGLEVAHTANVTHRDLKPENVFITVVAGAPLVRLIDFGIAKVRTEGATNLTVAGMLMGTLEYMAPEQARSADRADARSDLFAVGVMFYEMLAGRRPIMPEQGRLTSIRYEMGEARPLHEFRPDLPRELGALIEHALAPHPDQRFQSAREMRLHIDGALQRALAPNAPPPAVAQTNAPYMGMQGHAGGAGGHAHLQPGAPAGGGAPTPNFARVATVVGELSPLPPYGTPYGGTQVGGEHRAPQSYGSLPEGPRVVRRKHRIPWWAIVVPIVVGAFVVFVILVGSNPPAKIDPQIIATASPTQTASGPASLVTGPTATHASTLPPLAGLSQTNTTTERPVVRDAGATTQPTAIPTGIPTTNPFPMPTMAPLPTNLPQLPTNLPQLPTSFPTTFPTQFFPIPTPVVSSPIPPPPPPVGPGF